MNRFPYVFFGCQKVVLFANLFQSPSPGYLPYLPGPTLSPTSLVSTVVVKNKRVNLLRRRCQTMVFYSSGKLPQKFHCSKVRFLGRRARSSKTRGRSSQRSYAVLIYAYPMDISRLKSGIWRTPPTPHLEAQKTCGGWYISCGQVKYFSVFFCLIPHKYSRVKGRGIFPNFHGSGQQTKPCLWGHESIPHMVLHGDITIPCDLFQVLPKILPPSIWKGRNRCC